MRISKTAGHQVFDSRGNPTIEAVVTLENGLEGSAIVPSGASTGHNEAHELRDRNPRFYLGRSVCRAVEHVNSEIHQALKGKEVEAQRELDRILIELDGTESKSRLGANAILAVSLAAARTAAKFQDVPLHDYLSAGQGTLIPLPEIQIFGGGAHSARRIDFQDFMIVCTGAESFEHCLEMTFNVYHSAGQLMQERGKLAGLADEGGYWPVFDSNEEVFDTLLEAIGRAGYAAGSQVALSLDIAASEFFQNGEYKLSLGGERFTPADFCDHMIDFCSRYPIISIEDPFAEEDLSSWARFTQSVGERIQVVGDDLFVTNRKLLEHGIQNRLANSILIKPNQIGTLTETVDCIHTAQKAGWNPVVSARSGETEDPFISHLAVATNAGQLKVGSFARSERMVKWNEVLRIQRDLGTRARFIGAHIFSPSPKKAP